MSEWNCKKIENCFANTRSFAYGFSFPVTEELLERYADCGSLRVKKNFRRPCYFLDLHDGTRIRGILGEEQAKASFPEDNWESCKEHLEAELDRLVSK